MRLAQLARKVDTNAAEILKFLEEEFKVELGDDPNLKIEDDHLAAVIANFQKEEVIEETQTDENAVSKEVEEVDEISEKSASGGDEESDEQAVEEEIEEKKVAEVTDEKEEVVEEVVENETTTTDDSDDEEQTLIEAEVDENVELIKAPKVQLEGLKVVGKIDLPAPKTEESDSPPDVDLLDESASSTEEGAVTEAEHLEHFDESLNLPTAEEVEAEIEQEEAAAELLASAEGGDDLLAELEASQVSVSQDIKTGQTVSKMAKELKDNMDEEGDESIYKNKNGDYRFTAEQKANRVKRLIEVEEVRRQKDLKKKKKKHYNKMMSTHTPPKKPKRKADSKKVAEVEEAPKSAWGKFLRWLND